MYIDFLVFCTKGFWLYWVRCAIIVYTKKNPKTKTLAYKNRFRIRKLQDLASDLVYSHLLNWIFSFIYDLLLYHIVNSSFWIVYYSDVNILQIHLALVRQTNDALNSSLWNYTQNLRNLLLAYRAVGIVAFELRSTLHTKEIMATRHKSGNDFRATAHHTVFLLRSDVIVVIARVAIRRGTRAYNSIYFRNFTVQRCRSCQRIGRVT